MTFIKLPLLAVLLCIISACGGGDNNVVVSPSSQNAQSSIPPFSSATLAPQPATPPAAPPILPPTPLPAIPPDPNIIGKGAFTKDAKVFSADQATNSELTIDQFIVRKPQSTTYTKGDVLVVDAHGGRLIKITSKTEAIDKIIYGYVPAQLTEVFETLDVRLSRTLDSKLIGDRFTTGDPEVEISWKKSPAQNLVTTTGNYPLGDPRAAAVESAVDTLEIKYKKLGLQAGKGIEIDGSSSFKLNPDLQLSISKSSPNAPVSLDMIASISPDLLTSVSITSKFGGQVAYNLEKSFDLPAFRGVVVVPIGPVPVPVPFWVKPVITISGALNGTAGSKFLTKYDYSLSGKLGFAQTARDGLQIFNELKTTDAIVVSDVESELGVNITVPKVEVHFQLYSFVGPNFELGLENGLIGKSAVMGTPAIEGVEVVGATKIKVTGGVKASLDLKSITGAGPLSGFSGSFAPFSVTFKEFTLQQRKWFFPYNSVASIKVFDNGRVPDDIFEVSLDNVVLGRTTKGGSGQFRLKNLRPGERTLTVKTVEDDSPPGTYAVVLADGLRFVSGGTTTEGVIDLGQSISLKVIVPASAP